MRNDHAEPTKKDKEIYRINKACIDEIMDRISAAVRGRTYSYKKDIAGKDGGLILNADKLRALIKEMLDCWERQLYPDTNVDADTGESPAADYIAARREMYEEYLFCVMSVVNETEKDVTYETVLAKAGEFIADWCVMKEGDGTYNDIFDGIDHNKTFMYYEYLAEHYLSSRNMCSAGDMTDLGNKKRMDMPSTGLYVKTHSDHNDEEETEILEADPYEIPEEPDDMDVTLDDFGITAEEREAMDEYWQAEMEHRNDMEFTAGILPDGYEQACERFYALFQSADISTLRTFYEDLEQIVDMYLLSKNLTVLTDTDKCRKLYGALYDGALKQAKKYARGIEWTNM